MKLQTVHVRINDAATGKPTPCRVRCTDASGVYHAPFGRLTRFATAAGLGVGGNVLIDGEAWAYIDGACEIDLPPGEIRVQVKKGPEYRPLDERLQLIAGKLSLRLTLERHANLREEGWFSGDTRCHHLSPAAALLEGQAEDVAIVNVLIQEGRAFDARGEAQAWLGNVLEFSGQQPALRTAEHLVAVNSFNQAPMGTLSLLNTHRVVYPLTVERINWTLADWCGQCHRKAGLVVWSDADRCAEEGYVSEGLANLLLGDVDAIEINLPGPVASESPSPPVLRGPGVGVRGKAAPFASSIFDTWYHLLNAGVRIPLVGASGKSSNLKALGHFRTYAKPGWGQDLDYKNWIEAVRAGRTFVTNGPLLWFAVEGQEAGAIVQIPEGQDRVTVRALARGEGDSSLEIVKGGEVVERISGSEPMLDAEVLISESTWLAARCVDAHGLAHTSPVYVRVAGRPARPDHASLERIEAWLSGYPAFLAFLQNTCGFTGPTDRNRLEQVYAQALEAVRRKRRDAGNGSEA